MEDFGPTNDDVSKWLATSFAKVVRGNGEQNCKPSAIIPPVNWGVATLLAPGLTRISTPRQCSYQQQSNGFSKTHPTNRRRQHMNEHEPTHKQQGFDPSMLTLEGTLEFFTLMMTRWKMVQGWQVWPQEHNPTLIPSEMKLENTFVKAICNVQVATFCDLDLFWDPCICVCLKPRFNFCMITYWSENLLGLNLNLDSWNHGWTHWRRKLKLEMLPSITKQVLDFSTSNVVHHKSKNKF